MTAAVVLVDPILSGAPLVEAARARGLGVIAIIDLPRAFFPVLPDESRFDACLWEADAAAALRWLAGLKIEVRAVIAGAEAGVTLADELAEALGVRGNDPATRAARRNKLAMKEAAARAGLRVARARPCESGAEAIAFGEEVGWPIVVKTPEGAATVQVHRCDGPADAARRVREIRERPNLFHAPAPYALAEEFLDGDEYVVNALSDEDGVHVTDAWRYTKGDSGDAFALYYDTALEPLDPASPEVESVIRYGEALAAAVGVRYGLSHAEIKLTRLGPAMVEIAARPGGLRMPALLAQIAGFDAYKATIEAHLDGVAAARWPLRHAKHAHIVSCPTDRAGAVRAVHGLAAIAALPSYHAHHLAVGARVAPTTSLHDVPLTVWLVHPDRGQVARDAAAVRALFTIETDGDRL